MDYKSKYTGQEIDEHLTTAKNYKQILAEFLESIRSIFASKEELSDVSPRCLFYDWEKTAFTQEELVELRTAIGNGVPIIISRYYGTSMIYMRVSMTAVDRDSGAVTFRFPLYSGSSSNQKVIWTIAAGGSITKQTFNSI